MFNGIIFQAVTLTVASFPDAFHFTKSGLIKVTRPFTGIIMATELYFVFYLLPMGPLLLWVMFLPASKAGSASASVQVIVAVAA